MNTSRSWWRILFPLISHLFEICCTPPPPLASYMMKISCIRLYKVIILYVFTEIPIKSVIKAKITWHRITHPHLEKNLGKVRAACAQILIISNKISYLLLSILSWMNDLERLFFFIFFFIYGLRVWNQWNFCTDLIDCKDITWEKWQEEMLQILFCSDLKC